MGIIRILQSWIQNSLYDLPPDSIVKLRVHGKVSKEAIAVFRAPTLRALAPDTVKIDATLVEHADHRHCQK